MFKATSIKRLFCLIASLSLLSACTDIEDADLCPDDPNKIVPGVCGCGISDDDLNHNGVPDCLDAAIDMCPQDSNKTEPGICGCGISDDDSDHDGTPDCHDICPDDPKKTEAGTCGCGIPDDDLNHNGVPDCLDGDLDMCPQDPNKTEPGVCGCNISDDDSDADGFEDCKDLCPNDATKQNPGICGCNIADVDTDGDGIADCIEACPESPFKTFAGLCGCETEDSVENIADSDGDGVINCLDACPYEASKTENAGDGGCDVPDTDHDGVDDSADACPTNPNISDPIGTANVNCNIEDSANKTLYIYNAKDLELLRTKLATIHSNLSCSSSTSPSCLSSTSYRYCSDGLYRTRSCSSCAVAEGDTTPTCASATTIAISPTQLTIILMNDIDLADLHDVSLMPDGECRGLWKPIPEMTAVTLDGNGHKITFTHGHKTCSIPDALFDNITLSNVKNLSLEFGVHGDGRALLANNLKSSTLTSITYHGDIHTTSTSYVGGLVSYITNTQSQAPTLSNCHSEGISIDAPNASYTGGLVGYSSSSLTNPISEETFIVGRIHGKNTVGGIMGYIGQTFIFNYGSLTLSGNHTIQIQEISGNNDIGGIQGYGSINLNGTNSITIDALSGKDYVGGISTNGTISLSGTNTITISKIEGKNYVGGIQGTGETTLTGTNTITIDTLNGQNYVGGIIGSASSISMNTDNTITLGNVSGNNYVGGISGNSSSTISIKGKATINTNTLSGNEYIGGLFGNSSSSSITVDGSGNNNKDSIFINIDTLSGNNYIGGILGYIKANSSQTVTILKAKNHIHQFSGMSKLGGIIGDFNSSNTRDLSLSLNGIQSTVDNLDGFDHLGGVFGNLELHLSSGFLSTARINLEFSNLSNTANLYSQSPVTVGGFAGSMSFFIEGTSWLSTTRFDVLFDRVVNNTALYLVSPGTDGDKRTESRIYTSMFIGSYLIESKTDKIYQETLNTYYLAFHDKDNAFASSTDMNHLSPQQFTVDDINDIISTLGKPWEAVTFELGGEKIDVPMYVIQK